MFSPNRWDCLRGCLYSERTLRGWAMIFGKKHPGYLIHARRSFTVNRLVLELKREHGHER